VEMADYVLVGGAIATTFLKAQGYGVGESVVEAGQDENVKNIFAHAKEKNTYLFMPYDFICADSLKAQSDDVFPVHHVPDDQMIVDIGPETEALWGSIIDKANMIVWNGPVGYAENPHFSKGTDFIYYSIMENDHCYSVVGGGDTIAAISRKEYLEKISHISTGGGAMLEFIEKGTLPGIEALRQSRKQKE